MPTPTTAQSLGALLKSARDIMHNVKGNCDRPKIVPQRLRRAGTVRNVIRDVKFFAQQFNDHFDTQFPRFLRGLGFSDATVQAATN